MMAKMKMKNSVEELEYKKNFPEIVKKKKKTVNEKEKIFLLSIVHNDLVEIFERKILNYISQQILQHEIKSEKNSTSKRSLNFKI